MMTFRSQNGDMIAAAIIVLVALIAGTLGVVAWSSFISNQQDVSTPETQVPIVKDEVPAVPDDTLLYEGDTYTFAYPVKGWELIQEEGNSSQEVYPTIRTPDWAQSTMGLDAGAEASVYTRTATQGLDELRSNILIMDPSATEVPDVEIDGVPALSFEMDYEGKRIFTIVINDGIHYDIVYAYDNSGEASTHIDGYNTVISTFEFTK